MKTKLYEMISTNGIMKNKKLNLKKNNKSKYSIFITNFFNNNFIFQKRSKSNIF